MENIRDSIVSYFVGKWFNKEINLEINISEINRGSKYLFEYNPHIQTRNERIKQEETELMYGQKNDNFVFILNNMFGSFILVFLSNNQFQLVNENPATKEIKILLFERKNNVPLINKLQTA